MIIVIGGEKGGTGKTTIATNISAKMVSSGKDVLIIDTDKQGSASAWSSIRDDREDVSPIPCVQKFGNSIAPALIDLKNRYDTLIIDAGGRDSVELRAAMTVAEKLYIPLQASQFDVWTLSTMDKLVEQAKGFNPGLRAYVVINRASSNPAVSEASEIKEIFCDFDHLDLTETLVKDRIAYRKAARCGLSVFEHPSADPKATDEINSLYKEMLNG